MSELPPFRQFLITALIALTFAGIWGYFRLRTALAISLVVTAAFLVATLASFLQGIWIWTVAPASGAGTALALSLGANYFLEGKEKKRIRGLFARYVSDKVIGELLKRPEQVFLDGTRRKIAVLFADIKGFTTLSEVTAPEKVVELLNEYFETIVAVIQSHGGTVNSLMGDGLMAIFGAPIGDADAALHAVEAAKDMMKALGRVNESLKSRGFTPIEIGIGINSGEAVVGNMGSSRKMDYTAIGDVVNTASRIESQTRSTSGADILISEETQKWIGERVQSEFVKEAALKGKGLTVRLYKVEWK
jgi:adenylate cyclase